MNEILTEFKSTLSYITEENKGSKFWFELEAMEESPSIESSIIKTIFVDNHFLSSDSLLTQKLDQSIILKGSTKNQYYNRLNLNDLERG